jgi:hypothetical protein
MAIDFEKDIDELVNSLQVEDLVVYRSSCAFKVTGLAKKGRKLLSLKLNFEDVSIEDLRKNIFALLRPDSQGNYYLFGDLYYSEKELTEYDQRAGQSEEIK